MSDDELHREMNEIPKPDVKHPFTCNHKYQQEKKIIIPKFLIKSKWKFISPGAFFHPPQNSSLILFQLIFSSSTATLQLY